MKTYFYIILFLGGIGFSCKKKNFPENKFANNTVFYFKGDVNGQPTSIEAGVNDYFMFSSYGSNSNGVFNFAGDLKQTDCSSCGGSLFVQINDFKVLPTGAPVNVDSALLIKKYPFALPAPIAYGVGFQPVYNKVAATYLWNFGDGEKSNLASPYHSYLSAGNFNVCLTVTDANGCVSQICNDQKIGQFTDVCKTAISSSVVSGKTLQFKQFTSGTQPISYFWDFGDGKTSTQADPKHSYAVSGSYPVSLRVTDANRNVAIARYNALTADDLSSCAANYTLFASNTGSVMPEPLNLSAVKLTWMHIDGLVYTSVTNVQSPSNYFEILSIEDYETNELGQKTKKLHIRFKATVYNGSKSLTIDNAEAVIAVAYK